MSMADLLRAPKRKLVEWLWWGMRRDRDLLNYVDLQATFVEGNRLVFLRNLPQGTTADAILAAEKPKGAVRAGMWTDRRTAALEFSSGASADTYCITGASDQIGGSQVALSRPGYHPLPNLLGQNEQILHITGAHGIARSSLEEAFSLYGEITHLTNRNVEFQEPDAAAAAAENPYKIVGGKLLFCERRLINRRSFGGFHRRRTGLGQGPGNRPFPRPHPRACPQNQWRSRPVVLYHAGASYPATSYVPQFLPRSGYQPPFLPPSGYQTRFLQPSVYQPLPSQAWGQEITGYSHLPASAAVPPPSGYLPASSALPLPLPPPGVLVREEGPPAPEVPVFAVQPPWYVQLPLRQGVQAPPESTSPPPPPPPPGV